MILKAVQIAFCLLFQNIFNALCTVLSYAGGGKSTEMGIFFALSVQ